MHETWFQNGGKNKQKKRKIEGASVSDLHSKVAPLVARFDIINKALYECLIAPNLSTLFANEIERFHCGSPDICFPLDITQIKYWAGFPLVILSVARAYNQLSLTKTLTIDYNGAQ